jgi:hypothetical protein
VQPAEEVLYHRQAMAGTIILLGLSQQFALAHCLFVSVELANDRKRFAHRLWFALLGPLEGTPRVRPALRMTHLGALGREVLISAIAIADQGAFKRLKQFIDVSATAVGV